MKRKKGEGTVRLRTDGKWEARIIQNGKQKSFYGDCETEVRERLSAYRDKLEQGLKIGKNISFSELLDIWLERKRQELKPQSFHRLTTTVALHIKPILGHIDLNKINARLISEDVILPKAKVLSYSSVKKVYDALNAGLRYAQKSARITHNPMDLVVMPAKTSATFKKSASNGSIDILTHDEILRFIRAVQATYKNGDPVYKNGSLFILMLNTGLRIGEATALCRSDYDEQEKTLTVNAGMIQTKDENGKWALFKQNSVKTRHSERVIKLNAHAVKALPRVASGYLFRTGDGNPLHPSHVQSTLDRILKRANIPHKSTHVFRHTFASRLFEKGIDVRIISELLGHTNVSTTYNIYITLNKKQKAKAMEAIEDMY